MTKVVLVGSNQLTRHLIDWGQSADYWLFNEAAAHSWAVRCTGVFQMHAPAIWRNAANVNDKGHYAWLQQPRHFPVWMQDQYPDVPDSVRYPLGAVCHKLLPGIQRKGGNPVRLFTSSVAYALALAIYQGFEEIELVGFEMASGTEYAGQLPGAMFWLGIAAGRGVRIIVQDKSLLFRDKLYGYEGGFMIQRQRFEICANSLAPQVEQAKTVVFEGNGSLKNMLTALAIEKSQAKAEKLFGDYQTALTVHLDNCARYGFLAGRLSENQKYIEECDELIKAAGGEKALAAMVQNDAAN